MMQVSLILSRITGHIDGWAVSHWSSKPSNMIWSLHCLAARAEAGIYIVPCSLLLAIRSGVMILSLDLTLEPGVDLHFLLPAHYWTCVLTCRRSSEKATVSVGTYMCSLGSYLLAVVRLD